MFNLVNYKKTYKQLSNDTDDICQIIIKNDFKNELLKNQNYNVMLIFYHLLAIVYINVKSIKSFNKAEILTKKLVYETAIRLPDEYEELKVLLE